MNLYQTTNDRLTQGMFVDSFYHIRDPLISCFGPNIVACMPPNQSSVLPFLLSAYRRKCERRIQKYVYYSPLELPVLTCKDRLHQTFERKSETDYLLHPS